MRDEIRKIQELMEAVDYVTDAPIATSVYLAMRLRKPLLIEGPAGVGKTEVAKVMARMLGTNLIRLQCYEGLDASTALYEWNYQKQLLHIKLEEAGHNNRSMDEKEHEIFSEPFLLRRPLLQAITQESQAPVLLVDECDRCDEELEAFMLEVFSDWQVTIPEIGTIKATHPPHVILTSNRTRELSDALRRRCLYLWIDYPSLEKETRIIARKVPGIDARLSREISKFMETLRQVRLAKVPGVAETLDWAQALAALHADHLDEPILAETLGCLPKDSDDMKRFRAEGIPVLIPVPPADARESDAVLTSSGQKREGLALETWGEGHEAEDTGEPLSVPAASDDEALVGQDFSTFGADQLDEILRLTIKIARRLAHRLTRRRRPVRRRGRVDLRRTLRANLTRGDLIELRYRQRKRKKVRLVLLCDVSGSMDLYSRFLLQFLFALQNVFGRVETFIFSTRLTRITELLRGRSYRQVLRRLTDVRDWSGGTRIGESFAQFNREWPHLVDRRTIVIVLSDGWDTGEPDVLATELMRIKRRAARLIWLNPLLGNPSYEPLTRGMAAAMPLIDDFAAGHNLAALRDLAGKLHL